MPTRIRSTPLFAPALMASLMGLAIAGCSEPSQQALTGKGQVSTPSEGRGAATVTSILNAGVMADLGNTNAPVKILFDPLYDDHFGSLAELDDDLIAAIVTGAPPYDGVAAVFVSHAHGDHFSASQLNRMMATQRQVLLIAPGQARDAMRAEGGWQDGFAARITSIDLANGAATQSFSIGGALVEAFRSPHNGWPDRHGDVHNISYRVAARNGAGFMARVMHLGDADPAPEHFAPHAGLLASARTGLAIVPFWFLQQPDTANLLDRTLNAEALAAMHVPAREPAFLAGSGWTYFAGAGQQVDVPADSQDAAEQ